MKKGRPAWTCSSPLHGVERVSIDSSLAAMTYGYAVCDPLKQRRYNITPQSAHFPICHRQLLRLLHHAFKHLAPPSFPSPSLSFQVQAPQNKHCSFSDTHDHCKYTSHCHRHHQSTIEILLCNFPSPLSTAVDFRSFANNREEAFFFIV